MSNLSLEEQIRVQAYLLWEADGRPHGRASEYWDKAASQVTASRVRAAEANLASDGAKPQPATRAATSGKEKLPVSPAEPDAPAKKTKANAPATTDAEKPKKRPSKSAAASSASKKSDAPPVAKGTGVEAKTTETATKTPKKTKKTSEKS